MTCVNQAKKHVDVTAQPSARQRRQARLCAQPRPAVNCLTRSLSPLKPYTRSPARKASNLQMKLNCPLGEACETKLSSFLTLDTCSTPAINSRTEIATSFVLIIGPHTGLWVAIKKFDRALVKIYNQLRVAISVSSELENVWLSRWISIDDLRSFCTTSQRRRSNQPLHSKGRHGIYCACLCSFSKMTAFVRPHSMRASTMQRCDHVLISCNRS